MGVGATTTSCCSCCCCCCCGGGDFSRAERIFLQAGNAGGALGMYLAAGPKYHPEAMRLAMAHCPERVPEVSDRVKRASGGLGSLDGERRMGGGAGSSSNSGSGMMGSPGLGSPGAGRRGGGGGGGGGSGRGGEGGGTSASAGSPSAGSGGGASDPIATGRMWESSREYARAIDAYLSLLSPTAAHDMGACEGAWMTAVKLARQWDRGRCLEVCEEVAHRLAENKRWEGAAALFGDLGQPDRATDCYVRAGKWAKARGAAAGSAALLAAVESAARKANEAGGGGGGGVSFCNSSQF